MRYRGRVDQNQRSIADALRKAGYSVEFLANNGGGCPDLIVGRADGANIFLEVKNPALEKNKRVLTPDQKVWHSRWKGRVAVVETIEQALEELAR